MTIDESDEAARVGARLPVIGGVDVRVVAGCACLQIRRASRMATQLFEAHLQPAMVSVGQFGVMAQVYGSSLSRPPLTMKELSNAARHGSHNPEPDAETA